MRGYPSTLWLWLILTGIVVLSGLRFGILNRQSAAATTAEAIETLAAEAAVTLVPLLPVTPRAAVADSAPVTLPRAPSPSPALTDTIGPDDSIYLSLKGLGVSDAQILALGKALKTVFDAEKAARPGDSYTLQLAGDGSVTRFEYTPVAEPERLLIVYRDGDLLHGIEETLPVEYRQLALEVTIEDNLSNALASADDGDVLTDLLADGVFRSAIDFSKDPRTGDRLGVVCIALYKDDLFLRYQRILLARYSGQVVSSLAVRYQAPGGSVGYYDEKGVSLDRMFLLKPLAYRRISSSFSRKRFHPILKRNVPHLGTDYAANRGTDVWATARGRVTAAGRNGGYGKMVEIEHANGYSTRYAHLSRISVRKGQRVSKQDLIGRVGSTGRATGPHLHYELLKNGRHINPTSANKHSKGQPLKETHRRDFARQRDELLSILDGASARGSMVAVGDPR